MRIQRIEVSLVQGKVETPYVTAINPEGTTEVPCIILRMQTDTGLWGIAESNPYPGFTVESPQSVMQVIRHLLGPAVLGMDPCNIIALHSRMDAVVSGNPFAKAPIDIAAHDLMGQHLGVPIFRLLGGSVRDHIPMIWPIGGGAPTANARQATAKISEGYRSLHVKVGALHPDVDVARVQAIRKAVGAGIPIMIDANQGWDRSTAIQTIRRLQAFEPSMVEQPVPAWDIEGMAKVQAAVNVPISADEVLDSGHRAVELIRRDAARVFSIKTGKMGGLMRSRQIAAIAEAAGVPCFVNSMLELGVSVATSLHLAATLPNLVDHGHALMSNLRMKEDILVRNSFQYDEKNILIPEDCKGLGVQIDEEILDRRTLDRFVLKI
ncbi:MAG: hypothetical protein GY759_23740 [Chloroflexi bacterium]|nr:hypothetical protein [Chloroflexota bacterium]